MIAIAMTGHLRPILYTHTTPPSLACVQSLCTGTVSTLCFVWKFSCITFHSLIHAYMYINNASNLISVHQQGLVVRQVFD